MRAIPPEGRFRLHKYCIDKGLRPLETSKNYLKSDTRALIIWYTSHMKESSKLPMGASGFQITSQNGLTLSVQIGAGTYSDNHDLSFFKETKTPASRTMEIAVWNLEKEWLLEYDVAGYVSVSILPQIIELVAQGKITEIDELVVRSNIEN